jgi:hypothetical protein
VKHRSFFLAVAVATAAAAFGGLTPSAQLPLAIAATPPPSPPVLPTFTPQPAFTQPPNTPVPIQPPGALPTPSHAGNVTIPLGKSKATPTPAPPKDSRKGIEGVWEVQIQRSAITEYVHFKLTQDGNALTGVFMGSDGKKYALAGSIDGKNVRIVVTLPDGSSLIFAAVLDGTTDMLGLMTSAKEAVAFTAAYRPKENFLDNITPGPGGAGGGGMPPR